MFYHLRTLLGYVLELGKLAFVFNTCTWLETYDRFSPIMTLKCRLHGRPLLYRPWSIEQRSSM